MTTYSYVLGFTEGLPVILPDEGAEDLLTQQAMALLERHPEPVYAVISSKELTSESVLELHAQLEQGQLTWPQGVRAVILRQGAEAHLVLAPHSPP